MRQSLLNLKSNITEVAHSAAFVMKVKDYYKSFLAYKQATCKNKGSVITYKRSLRYFAPIADKEVSELKKNDDALIIAAATGHGAHGPKLAVLTFRTFLCFLEDEGVPIPFRWEKIRIPYPDRRQQPYVTEQEFEDSVELLDVNKFYELRDRTLYELLWACGLRINEALSITIKDINFEKREIAVHRLKGGGEDVVDITDRLEYWLNRYLERRPEHEFLFVNVDCGDASGKLNDSMARHRIAYYRKKYGKAFKLGHHIERRGFVTDLLEKNVNPKVVQYAGGWKSIRTPMEFYAQYEKKKARQVVLRVRNQARETPMTKTVTKLLNGDK